MAFTYSTNDGRYRDSSGRLLTWRELANEVDYALVSHSANLAQLADEFRRGQLSYPEWVIAASNEIKDAQRAVAYIAVGGRDLMTQADWGRVGQAIRRQLEYFNGFANEVFNRPTATSLTDAFVSRAESYGDAAYPTYQQLLSDRLERFDQADWEENVLDDGAENCAGCIDAAEMGRVPIGTLPPIGARDCLFRCRCYIDFGTGDAA